MESKKIYRSRTNKVFAGVCGGMGDYFSVDPVLIRLIWVVATFFSLGAGLLAYVIAFAVIPVKDSSGEEKRNYGCLYLLLIIILAAITIPVISGILGYLGHTFVSGVSLFSGAFGGAYGSGISIVGMAFLCLCGLVGIAIILVIVFLLKAIIRKDK